MFEKKELTNLELLIILLFNYNENITQFILYTHNFNITTN